MAQLLDSFDSESTRGNIILTAFEEMHIHGYQGLRIDAILNKTGLAKGAFYHHFSSKVNLAYAVIDEFLHDHFHSHFKAQLQAFDDPLEGLCEVLINCPNEMTEEEVCLGCPVNNLAQEMSGLDDGFKTRLQRIYESWCGLIADCLARAQQQKIIADTHDVKQLAMFIMCAFQGISGLAKCMQSKQMLIDQQRILAQLISGLRI